MKQLVAEARKNRCVNTSENGNDFIKITPAIKEAILNTNPQRSNRFLWFLNVKNEEIYNFHSHKRNGKLLTKSKEKLKRENQIVRSKSTANQNIRNKNDLSDQEDQNNDLEPGKTRQKEEKKAFDMDQFKELIFKK